MTASDGAARNRSGTTAGESSGDEAGRVVDGSEPVASADSPPDEDGQTDAPDRSPVAVYRWTCPICGETRTGMASAGEDPREKAAFSLRQHVQTSADEAHGPANVYPARFDPDAADRAVSVD